MQRNLPFPPSLRLLALLLACVPLPGCWWDGSSHASSPATYSVGGSISGLATSGLVLANGADRITVAANATTFSFPTALAADASYSVTVATQPAGATCVVSSGSGTASATITSVRVTCTAAMVHLGGSLSGLSASGLVLVNGADTVSPAANAASFTFPKTVAVGTTYGVSVRTQPAGLSCTVSGGSGTAGSTDVNSVAVTCAATGYHVGGTIAGLSVAGLVLANGMDTVSPAANAVTFRLPTAVATGIAYAITVQSTPTGLTCTVTGGTGIVGTADVTTVSVNCSAGAGFVPLAGQSSCPSGFPDRNGTGSAASLPLPTNIVVDAAGNAYTSSVYSSVVNKITAAGVVTTLAGQFDAPGYTDGTGTAAQFDSSVILGGVDALGNLYLSETSNIRRVTAAGVVSTLSGPATSEQGYVDAAGSAARFSAWGLGVTSDGTSYVADYANQVVRKVTPVGVATTLAGQPHQYGFVDGVGSAAQFKDPKFAVVDAGGTVYVSDQNGNTIRKITSDGTVTTLAGNSTNGWADGPGATAMFYDIRGLALGPSGSVYVLDQSATTNGSSVGNDKWGAIRQIAADGTVTTVVESTAAASYFAAPPGAPLKISEPLTNIGSAPDGTLFVASRCAVGKLTLP